MDSDSDDDSTQHTRRRPSPPRSIDYISDSDLNDRDYYDSEVDKGGRLKEDQIDYSLDDVNSELEELESNISVTDYIWGEHYQKVLNFSPKGAWQVPSWRFWRKRMKLDLIRENNNSNKFWSREEKEEGLALLKEKGYHNFMNEYLAKRQMSIRELLYAFDVTVPTETREGGDEKMMSILKQVMLRTLRKRAKLIGHNTLEDALNLMRNARKVIVLSGAGISVSCGIPDFRSRNGLYAMLQQKDEYNLDDPQQMFDINYFREDPEVFYSFAYKIYPSNFKPSPCHRFIRELEKRGKLLRNYTQNIDTLETLAGITRVLQCHGSFATASCIECRTKVPGTDIKDAILNQRVALCKVCNAQPKNKPKAPTKKKGRKKKKAKCDWWESDEYDQPIGMLKYPPGIMKPDITFFGEKLTDDFDEKLFQDRSEVDLLLIIGTSLNVAPVSDILTHIPHSVPRIVVNKTPLFHVNADINLLGNADTIIEYLSAKLGWNISESSPVAMENGRNPQGVHTQPVVETVIERVQTTESTVAYLFEGAEGARNLENKGFPLIWDSYAWAEAKAKLNMREKNFEWTDFEADDETEDEIADKGSEDSGQEVESEGEMAGERRTVNGDGSKGTINGNSEPRHRHKHKDVNGSRNKQKEDEENDSERNPKRQRR